MTAKTLHHFHYQHHTLNWDFFRETLAPIFGWIFQANELDKDWNVTDQDLRFFDGTDDMEEYVRSFRE